MARIESQKPRRNDPCWCGSGKKFKKCHLGRSQESRPPISELMRSLSRIQHRKTCLHPNASPEGCSAKIVRAHTVQSTLLAQIARNSHVYGFPTELGALIASDGIPTPQLIGINRASTFTGFCSRHDAELFAPIEKSRLQPCQEHACLLAYRGIARELYAKEGIVAIQEHLSTLDRGLPEEGQFLFQQINNARSCGSVVGLSDVVRAKTALEDMIRSRDFSDMEYYVVWLAEPPNVMCAVPKVPSWDFDGNQLQDVADLSTPMHPIDLTLAASGDLGIAFFSWTRSAAAPCRAILRSLLKMSDASIPDAILRFTFGGFENQFMNPEWWENLDKNIQERLVDRFHRAVHPDMPVSSDYLADDGCRAVQWSITGHDTNVHELGNLRNIEVAT